MRRILRTGLLASTFAFGVTPFVLPAVNACAQAYDDSVGFDAFHDQLASYGNWLYSDRWGLVWQPADVSYDFRPYFSSGHWVYTDDYGWYWASDVPWGDIAFHYGRWVDDPDDGWLWMPGYTWSPAWVVWRTNGEYVGWMPAPPDGAFLEGRGDVAFGASFGVGGGRISFNWSDPYYGYRTWYGPDFDERRFADNWVFVSIGHVADADYRRFVVRNPVQVANFIRTTRNVTNYTVVNNFVVNRSIDVHLVERAAGHPIAITPARAVIRQPNLVTRVDVGRRVAMRVHETMPMHATGFANSAPPPPPNIVDKLSAQAATRNGRQPAHLFTKTTVASPDVQNRFRGRAQSGMDNAVQPGGRAGEGNMNGPGSERSGETNGSGPPTPENAGPGTGMAHHGQSGQTGGMNGPGGQMNGPGGNGAGRSASPESERRGGEPSAQPGGANPPNSEMGPQSNGPNAPQSGRRPDEQNARPGGMNGPGNQNGAEPGREGSQGGARSEPAGQNPPSGGMNGPGATNGPGGRSDGTRGRNQPSGGNGPQGGNPGATEEPRNPKSAPNPNGQPPKKPEKKNPDNPPGTPQ